MAALPLVLTLAPTALAASGQMKQAQAQQQAAQFNQQVAQQNVNIAASEGAAASAIQTQQTERELGAATAAYGAAGVQENTGSAADVLESSARNATLNNLTLKYNYTLKGLGYTNLANLDQAAGANEKQAGGMGAAASLLSGGMKAYTMFGGGTPTPGVGADSANVGWQSTMAGD